MLTLHVGSGHVSSILSEARSIAAVTKHSVEFKFNGVVVNVASTYFGEPNPLEDISKILEAVKFEQKDTLYL